ncbi:MAG: beta-L-arabinofuranosidase domain-containing protein [Candidatus Saccharibacteria bacterium]
MRVSVLVIVLTVFIFYSNGLLAQDKLYPNEFPLHDVQLLDGPFKKARDLNLQTLLKYDVDRLLAPYRKEAGLPEKAKCYPNWDGLDGHVGGHYLSAMAINYAATGNAECKRRMDHMIFELKACQDANALKYPDWGVGYVGGIPNSAGLWPKIKNGEVGVIWKYWAPYYNIHKMFAGLRDAWLYTGNQQAKAIFLHFCDWAIAITSNLSDAQVEEMLGNEHGGMNEVLADAYQISGDKKYLEGARRYSHKMFLEPLSKGIDNLDNKHANTQIPKFIGFARIAELGGDTQYAKAGAFFWETVTRNRSLAFGGNSRREHFPAKESCIDFINVNDGPESCNSYNMLKLTEDLFRAHPLAQYADYYERTVYNHILSTQHPEHGGYVYFTPARPRHYRVYSAPNEAMWCCVGTGMENHGKYNQFIYTYTKDSLFLNLFIASELNWKEKGIKIRQETLFPDEEKTKLTITDGSSHFKLMIRYPVWVSKGALKITVNGKDQSISSDPSSYVGIERKWEKGDVVQISLPMHTSIERLPNVAEYVAIMHGPVLLGAKTGTEDLKGLIADDSRWGQYAGGEYLPVDKAPILIVDDIQSIGDKLIPVKDKPLNYKLNVNMGNPADLTLEPFYKIHDARYMMYWLALSSSGYKAYTDSLANMEKEKLALENRTIDQVAAGEQQPEVDHAIQLEKSNKGNNLNEFFRDARDGGYFSYDLATKSVTNVSLQVRYWGAEWGTRKFDITIDDEKLITEDNTNKWNQSAFKEVVYPIPDSMVKGKSHIRVKFQALPGNTAGAVYHIRLIKNNQDENHQ